MLEISLVTESDRAEWEVLARGHHTHFAHDISDDSYEPTWQKLLADRIRGIIARLDGKAIGVAHYVFHASVWGNGGRCYLADLFVEPAARRRGVATAMINWVATDAKEHGAPRLYWNTLTDAPARALYDRLAKYNEGLILYTYRR